MKKMVGVFGSGTTALERAPFQCLRSSEPISIQSGVQTLLAALQRTLSSLASDICGDWRMDTFYIFYVQLDFANMVVDPLNRFQRVYMCCIWIYVYFTCIFLENRCSFKKVFI